MPTEGRPPLPPIPTRGRRAGAGPDMQVLDPDGLRRGRKVKGWTQRQMGALCRVSQTTIWKIETRRFDRVAESVAMAWARNLELDWEKFFVDPTAVPVPRDPIGPESVSTPVAS